MHSRSGGAFVYALPFLLAARVAAQDAVPKPLTLDEALARFRTRGFDLLIADAAVAGARGDVIAAGAVANPQLSLSRGSSSTYDPSLCSGCSSTSNSVTLTDQAALSDTLSGKRRLRVAVQQAALGVATRSRADVQRTLEAAVKQQLLAAELAKQSLANARTSAGLSGETADLVRKRYHAGAVSEADVARAEVQRLEAEQAADAAAQALASAKAGLGYLIGEPGDFDVSADLLRDDAAPRLDAATRDGLLRDALAHRPDLGAASFQIERARSALQLARRQRVPDFFPSLGYSAEGRGQSAIQPPTVTLGVSAALPLFYRNRGEITRAAADLEAQQTARRKVEAQVGADVASAHAAYVGARQRLARMRETLLPSAARARDLVRLQYEKGAASLLELLDAQRTFLAAQSESLQTLNDYWTAVFALEAATGMELRS
jgi:cobalt-zinc-cadmium efflux system outer membrane protein